VCKDCDLDYLGFCQTCHAYLITRLNISVEYERFLILWETQSLFKEAISKAVLKALDKQTCADIEGLNKRGSCCES
jgi:hypothetical protein